MEVVRVAEVMGVVVSAAAAVVIFGVWRRQDKRNGGRCGGRAVEGQFCIGRRYFRVLGGWGTVRAARWVGLLEEWLWRLGGRSSVSVGSARWLFE